jgi:hypothetical protein
MTPIPKTIEVNADTLKKVVDLSRWILQMPPCVTEGEDFYPGDRFHEKVFEFRMKVIPTDIFDEGDVYVSHFELNDETVYVMFGRDPMPPEQLAETEFGLFRCELVAK